MLVQQRLIDSNISVISNKDFHSININEVVVTFIEKRNRGIIQAMTFEDDIWYFNDEKHRRKIKFDVDELDYARAGKERALPQYKDFKNALKAFILYRIDDRALTSSYNVLSLIKRWMSATEFFHPNKKSVLLKNKFVENESYFKQLHHLIDFLEFIQLEDSEDILSLLYYQTESFLSFRADNNGFNQRDLSTFESMFELDYVMEQFWDTCSVEEKEKFYPIKLWWSISTVIPIRTTELILTPYDCLEIKNGEYFLTLRRSKLKGFRTNSQVKHRVDEDYELHQLRINEELYRLISEYRQMVDEYDTQPDFYYDGCPPINQRKFLFSHRSYYKCLEFKNVTVAISSFLDLFTASNLNSLLRRFYSEVLINMFNYELVEKGSEELKVFQLELISLMDTRHFAFINMALNDVEPLIMKKISGHGSVQSSYHYYSHLDKYVKCYTYNMARKLQNKEAVKKNVSVLNSQKSRTSELIFKQVFKDEVTDEDMQTYKAIAGGRCKSNQKQFEDCMQVNNVCDICPHYIPNLTDAQKSITERVKENEQKISIQIQALKEMVKQYDKIKNFNEDYGLKINIIKTIANQNAVMMSKYFI